MFATLRNKSVFLVVDAIQNYDVFNIYDKKYKAYLEGFNNSNNVIYFVFSGRSIAVALTRNDAMLFKNVYFKEANPESRRVFIIDERIDGNHILYDFGKSLNSNQNGLRTSTICDSLFMRLGYAINIKKDIFPEKYIGFDLIDKSTSTNDMIDDLSERLGNTFSPGYFSTNPFITQAVNDNQEDDADDADDANNADDKEDNTCSVNFGFNEIYDPLENDLKLEEPLTEESDVEYNTCLTDQSKKNNEEDETAWSRILKKKKKRNNLMKNRLKNRKKRSYTSSQQSIDVPISQDDSSNLKWEMLSVDELEIGDISRKLDRDNQYYSENEYYDQDSWS
jgi:hypothetical protein